MESHKSLSKVARDFHQRMSLECNCALIPQQNECIDDDEGLTSHGRRPLETRSSKHLLLVSDSGLLVGWAVPLVVLGLLLSRGFSKGAELGVLIRVTV